MPLSRIAHLRASELLDSAHIANFVILTSRVSIKEYDISRRVLNKRIIIRATQRNILMKLMTRDVVKLLMFNPARKSEGVSVSVKSSPATYNGDGDGEEEGTSHRR